MYKYQSREDAARLSLYTRFIPRIDVFLTRHFGAGPQHGPRRFTEVNRPFWSLRGPFVIRLWSGCGVHCKMRGFWSEGGLFLMVGVVRVGSIIFVSSLLYSATVRRPAPARYLARARPLLCPARGSPRREVCCEERKTNPKSKKTRTGGFCTNTAHCIQPRICVFHATCLLYKTNVHDCTFSYMLTTAVTVVFSTYKGGATCSTITLSSAEHDWAETPCKQRCELEPNCELNRTICDDVWR